MPRSTLVKNIPEGSRFTRWLVCGEPVWSEVKNSKRRNRRLLIPCRCDCGTESLVSPSSLRSGTSKSCGCIQVEYARSRTPTNQTHNLSMHPLHNVWCSMRSRCLNKLNKHYNNYGMLGISVCKEWESFEEFYEWAEKRWSRGLDIDRVNNSLGYSPENCRFVTRKENLRNRRNTIRIEWNSETLALSAFAELIKVPYHLVYQRHKAGMNPVSIVNDLERLGYCPVHEPSN